VEDHFVDMTDEQVCCFHEQGFLRLGGCTTDQELTWLQRICDEVVEQELGYALQELGPVRAEQESLVTIVSPEKIAPALRDTFFYRQVRNVFTRLFAVEEALLLTAWRIFCKPPYSDETPWHQDAAYRPPPHRSVGVWMALDPTTSENSCLYYIAGSHRAGLYPHHLHDDHLAADKIDSSQAIACPMKAGEAVVHHCCTLHYAGPNNTNRPRRAVAIVCQVTENS
jgi:hypothetical protein